MILNLAKRIVTDNAQRNDEQPGRRSGSWADGRGQAVADVLRALAAAGVLLSAVIHLELWVEGFQQLRVIGPLFMLNAVGGLLIAVVMLLWRHWLPAGAATVFGVATAVALLISATAGLFGVTETLTGVPQYMSLIGDIVAACCGGGLAVAHLTRR